MNERDSSKTRVLLVDDHPLLRRGLAQLVNQEKDMSVVGEAEDVVSALKLVEDHKPDVAVVDLSLKDSNGMDLIKDIRLRAPNTLVLVLSMHDESFYAERVLRAGARGYITKGENSAKVIEGIRDVMRGKVFVNESISSRMLSKFVGDRTGVGGIESLSDREFEIIAMIGRGMQTREIAKKLHLSVKTIDAHRDNIKRKLNLPDASELLKYAIKWAQSEKEM